MTYRKLLPPCLFLLAPLLTFAAPQRVTVAVANDLSIARPSETIAVPWTDVAQALPDAMILNLVVRDAHGRSLPYQVTPQIVNQDGASDTLYDELIFQHDFAPGEKTATFTIETSDQVAPPFPTKTFARFVPERYDDFAWENDRIGHRTYGPALAAAETTGSGKEVLISSGLDVWSKRVDYPIVDRWYLKRHYHHDQGEGMDMYEVGPSRGCGGTGVWDGQHLYVSRNFAAWRILTTGPIRTVFELRYETWAADKVYVAEVKRFTVDAGHNLDRIESTFTITGADKITVGIGLNKTPAKPDQAAKIALTSQAGAGSLSQWIEEKTNGALGTAIIVPGDGFRGFAEDPRNELILATAKSGQPLRYLAGAAWDRRGNFKSQAEWESHVADAVARARSPLKIAIAPRS